MPKPPALPTIIDGDYRLVRSRRPRQREPRLDGFLGTLAPATAISAFMAVAFLTALLAFALFGR